MALDPTITLNKVNKLTEPSKIPKILGGMKEQLIGSEDRIKFLFAIKSDRDYQDVVECLLTLIKKLKNWINYTPITSASHSKTASSSSNVKTAFNSMRPT